MTLADGIANERVVGLQIQDVKLVDARRDQQKRFFVNFGGEWFVLNQLKIFIFKNHSTFRGGHVLTHHKLAFIGHRHMALLHVVQQILNAFGQALTLGFDGLFLGFRIEG